jgi:hypothetical protein
MRERGGCDDVKYLPGKSPLLVLARERSLLHSIILSMRDLRSRMSTVVIH